MSVPVDHAARERALDPSRSFFVRAPAGSGKTELLIRRYLRLLATVKRPEQVLAITFTRKAAGEMRERVMSALRAAHAQVPPEAEHLQRSYGLACEALRQSAARDWDLLGNPQRLRIQTIDAVNARLSNGAPLTAGATASFRISDDPDALYRRAARDTIAQALEPDIAGDALKLLLEQLDNDAARLERLLSAMLARRDIWLHDVVTASRVDAATLRDAMRASLKRLVRERLEQARRQIPSECDAQFAALLPVAARHLAARGHAETLQAWLDTTDFPPPDIAQLARWQQLAGLVLIKGSKPARWRRRFDAKVGFPAARARREAERMGKLASALQAQAGLADVLYEVRALPDPEQAVSGPLLNAVLEALPLAVANLKLVFRAQREKDFAEVAQEAIVALGAEDAPTELALQLDYEFRHILVDEFQDTSRAQFDLLHHLTAGWHGGSGQTLFAVGDPMQSIYRFRKADVQLFLDAWESGLGPVAMERLTLSANFRSDPAIVGWTNRIFEAMRSESGRTAIGFAPATSQRSPDPGAQVSWHRVARGDAVAEAQRVVSIVRSHLDADDGTLGILVRSRAHAAEISGQLRAAGIRFGAADLERLVDRSPVQDVVALTRALYHLGDRLAWLAVLRAPWCGLTLYDLHALATRDLEASIWSLLGDEQALAALSADGRARASRLHHVLQRSLERRGHLPVRDVVEGAWLDLCGAATLTDPADCDWIDRLLAHLDTLDVGGDLAETSAITAQLGAVYLTSGDADARVQIMTMHKAKGLEFDTVVLPGLARPPRSDERPLLLIRDRVTAQADGAMLFAVDTARGRADADPLFDYLWQRERDDNAAELDRLLYVATTRARCRLHLLTDLAEDEETGDVRAPPANSLLARIFATVAAELDQVEVDAPSIDATVGGPDWAEVPLRRLPAGFSIEADVPESSSASEAVRFESIDDIEYDWATTGAVFVGRVVHRWLQEIATRGIANFDGGKIANMRPLFARQLRALGAAPDELTDDVDRVVAALTGALADDTGRWILADNHPEADSELSIHHDHGAGPVMRIIDRTFVTTEGIRWIIDYKTGTHEGGDVETFVASEVSRYREQLSRYIAALRELDARPIRAALYFPLLGVLREVEPGVAADVASE